ETALQLLSAWNLGERMVCLRQHPLPREHGEPARLLEQLSQIDDEVCVRLIDVPALLQRVREGDRLAVSPKRRVGTLGRLVVKKQEVANLFGLDAHELVVFRNRLRIEPAAR